MSFLHVGLNGPDDYYTKCGIHWQKIMIGDGVTPEKIKDEPLPDEMKNHLKCVECWK